jgi:putative nucleotidyltransferase with HDIG domain
MNTRDKATMLVDLLERNGAEAWFVGGCVRDTILGREPHDFDIVTRSPPEEVEKILRPHVDAFTEVGKSFGIVVAVVRGEPFEIATTRIDVGGSDGRHPDRVELGPEIQDDLSRRDFTMNAIAMKNDGRLIDPFDGKRAIELGAIHFVGSPADRIREDRLRILRAIRFQSQLGFVIGEADFEAICADPSLEGVSQERITAEFLKILSGDSAPVALDSLRRSGVLWEIIPELRDLLQPHDSPWHLEADGTGNTIWAHVNLVFEHACNETKDMDPDRRLRIRLGALMHDVAKPAVREERGDHSRFLHHDVVGAKMTQEILTRIRCPTSLVNPVVELVRMHMNCHDIQKMKKVHKIRRLLGRPDIDDILLVGECDTMATVNAEFVLEQDRTMEFVELWRSEFPVMLPKPLVNGDDLVKAGAKPGPGFKLGLDEAFDQQLNGVTDKGRLVRLAKNRAEAAV